MTLTSNGIFQLVFYLAVLLLLVKPLGAYMAGIYEGRSIVNRIFHPVEQRLYRIIGTHEDAEMNWKTYALAMLVFNALGLMLVYALQRVQAALPLNPLALGAVSPDLAFNTAVSFATNTNWQGYGGETTMSYLTQMVGLTVQNFVSAATGMALLVALICGLARRTTQVIGNFWVDLTRTIFIFCCRCRSSVRWCWCRRAWCRLSRVRRRRSWLKRGRIPAGMPLPIR